MAYETRMQQHDYFLTFSHHLRWIFRCPLNQSFRWTKFEKLDPGSDRDPYRREWSDAGAQHQPFFQWFWCGQKPPMHTCETCQCLRSKLVSIFIACRLCEQKCETVSPWVLPGVTHFWRLWLFELKKPTLRFGYRVIHFTLLRSHAQECGLGKIYSGSHQQL